MIFETSKERAERFVRHADEAVKLLRKAKLICELTETNLVDRSKAVEAVVELNRQAVQLVDEALRLQKTAKINKGLN